MKTIKIGFSTSKTRFPFLSWIIKKVEGTNFSHVYIKLENDSLGDLYYHASGSKVNFMGNRIFNRKNLVIEEYELKLSNNKYYNILNFAIDKVGESYSVSQLFGILIVRIFVLFGKNIKNPFGKKGYICTELVGEALKTISDKKMGKELNNLTLKDIKNLISNKDEYNTI